VDLVAIGGDLVDQANRYLEAVGPLETGLRQLTAAGITTVVVAGNHDHDVLPVLVDSMAADSIRLLGRDGRWERFTFERRGERIHLDGWSFPRSHYQDTPLRHYSPEKGDDDTPVLALLHADLDQPTSRYAPISLSELRRHSAVFFLLGHVHAPRLVEEPGGVRYLYAGSPQAIDRGETGAHGAWLITVRKPDLSVSPLSLSSIRYDVVQASAEGLTAASDIEGRVFAAIRDDLDLIASGSHPPLCVRYRVRVVGRSRFRQAIEARLNLYAEELELTIGSTTGSIESVVVETTTEHDLDAIESGIGAPAVVASLLKTASLDERLSAELSRLVAEIHGSRSFAEVGGGQEDLDRMEGGAMAELRRAASVLLDELLVQKVESR